MANDALPVDCRLAVYGTLKPGCSNHHHVSDIAGTWTQGVVRGTYHADGWHGYPGIDLDPAGEPVPVQVLESRGLPAHLSRLDAVEGPGYVRMVTRVETIKGTVEAQIYALRRED